MKMKNRLLAILAVSLLAGPMAANATLLGAWEGSWSVGGYAADFDLTFDSETSGGAFTGYFDWICTAGLTCSGREFFSGTLTGANLAFATTSIGAGAVNIGPSSYWGSLLDPSTLSGTDSKHRAVGEPREFRARASRSRARLRCWVSAWSGLALASGASAPERTRRRNEEPGSAPGFSLATNSSLNWRPHGDSNPGRNRERVVS